MSKRLIATLAAALVVVVVLAGVASPSARTNQRLRDKLRALTEQVELLEDRGQRLEELSSIAEDKLILMSRSGRYFGIVEANHVLTFANCNPGDPAVWEDSTPDKTAEGEAPTLVLSC